MTFVTGYIVMQGADYEGLLNDEEAYDVIFDRRVAEKKQQEMAGRNYSPDIIVLRIPAGPLQGRAGF